MSLILDFSPLVESAAESGPLLNIPKFCLVADVASASSGPVDVPAFGALPVFGRKQTLALLCGVLANLDAQLLFAAFAATFRRFLRLAPVAAVTPGKVDVTT